MKQFIGQLCVYYDGACPRCVRDRQTYARLAGGSAKSINWVDISRQEQSLRNLGIDPHRALKELHVKDERGRIVSELDAYVLLMRQAKLLRPMAWMIGLPGIRPLLSRLYHRMVERRLRRSGRL